MSTKHKLNKIKWKCRRGMLELDLILQDFVEKKYSDLSEVDQLAFEKLLECTDPELIRYLLNFEVPKDSALKEIIIKMMN